MNNKQKKIEPGRLLIGIASIACIVYMGAKGNVIEIYKTMPKEQILPLVATTIAVSLIKVLVVAGALLFIKGIIQKLKKNK